MKNLILKIVLFLGIITTFHVDAGILGPNIKVKGDGADTATYTTQINNVSNDNTALNFELTGVFTGTSTGKYSLSFPNGFVLSSYTTNETTCNNVRLSFISNTSFLFDVSSTNQTCVVKFVLNYVVTPLASGGIQQINVLDLVNFTNTNGLTVGVTNVVASNYIQKAETLDTDSNGYIDTYKLTFATGGLTNFSNVGLTVGSLTPSLSGGVVGNTVYLSFDNTTYTTGNIPQIIDTDGGIFTGIAPIQINDIVETDTANPLLKTFNGGSGALSHFSLAQNDKITLVFTEKVLSSSIFSGFILKENGINITNSAYIQFNQTNGETISYCIGGYSASGACLGGFDPLKNYTLELGSSILDLKGNMFSARILNFSIISQYVTISSLSPFFTKQISVTLTGTCGNNLGDASVEYSLNGTGYINVNSDNCNTTHNWNQTLTVLQNTNNSFLLRMKSNPTVSKALTIVNDTLPPSSGSLVLQLTGSNSAASGSVSVSVVSNDANGVYQMCLSEQVLISDDVCPTGWKTYNPNLEYTFPDNTGTKTLYVKFRDAAGNISPVTSNSIVLNGNNNNNNNNGNNGGGGSGGGSSGGSGGGGGIRTVQDNTQNSSYVVGGSGSGNIIYEFSTKAVIDEKRNFLSRELKNENLKKFIDVLGMPLIVPSMDYYLTIHTPLRNQYLSIVDAYVSLLISIDNFYISKDVKYVDAARNAYKIYQTFATFKNTDFEEYYVTKNDVDGIMIYRTKNTVYFSVLSKIEAIVFSKFHLLLNTGTIAKYFYKDGVNNYNQFVLHFTIYKQTGYTKALDKTLDVAKKFVKIYNLKIK